MDEIAESPEFQAAREAHFAANGTFKTALWAEVQRVGLLAVPDAVTLNYSLEYNEEYELKATISSFEGKDGLIEIPDEEMDELRDRLEPYLDWLAVLDGWDPSDGMVFELVEP